METDRQVEQLAYSPVEVSHALGLGRTLTYDLIKRGEIRAIKVGRRIIVPRQAVSDFLETNSTKIS